MLTVQFDFSQIEKQALSIGAAVDQIPYAMALALNKAADTTRMLLIKHTWPGHIQQRNASFIAASLTTKEARASKTSLAVEIYDKLDRGNLQMQAKGGSRKPLGGGNLAVPASTLKRTSRGVPSRYRPRNLKVAFKSNNLLFTREGKKGKVRLLYALKPTTRIPKRVPFYEDYATSMQRELQHNLPAAVKHAMATRR